MPLIVLRGKPLQYEIARNPQRKRLTLEVSPDRRIIVRAPLGVDDDRAEAFVRQCEEWLFAALAQAEAPPEEKTRRVEDELGPLEYVLSRNRRRRRLVLYVHRDGKIEVRAPVRATLGEIDAFVRGKTDWIRQMLSKVEQSRPAAREFVTGESILYRGKPHTLQVEVALFEESRVLLQGTTLRVQIGPAADEWHRRNRVRNALRQWLVDRALEEAKAQMPALAEKIGVRFRQVRMRDLKSRWGSCSGRGAISISFRIIMAPPKVVEYLFIHELCHLVHPNHSAEFWTLVAQHLPDHKRHRKWLRQHEEEMVI